MEESKNNPTELRAAQIKAATELTLDLAPKLASDIKTYTDVWLKLFKAIKKETDL